MQQGPAPAIPAIGLGVALAALLLVGGAALAWRRAAERTQPDHQIAMALMLAAMLGGMMAGLCGGVLGLSLPLFHAGLWSATLLGVEVGVLAGLLTGMPGGIAPTVEGAMGGLMGGLMGAMLLQMVPGAARPLFSLLLLFWLWAEVVLARLLAPDLAYRWFLLTAVILSALVLGLWGPPWLSSR